MDKIFPIFGLAFLGSIAGLSGGLFLLWKEKIAKSHSIHLISFAAGAILAAAFLDLLPEAVEQGGSGIFIFALIGLVVFFLVEDLILHFHHHEGHAHSLKSAAPLIVASDSVHNFIDGVVISASFIADPKLGLVVAVATFFHEIPQEIGDFAVLLSSGMTRWKVVLSNIFSALATFAGALVSFYFISRTGNFLAPLLGLASGMFLYISSADILPELVKGTHKDSRWHVAGFFLLGLVLVFIMTKLVPA